MNVFEKIESGYYKNTLSRPVFLRDPISQKQLGAYMEEEGRLNFLFQEEVLEELGLTNHPKAELLFSMAWEYGHALGYSEIFHWALELSRLLK